MKRKRKKRRRLRCADVTVTEDAHRKPETKGEDDDKNDSGDRQKKEKHQKHGVDAKERSIIRSYFFFISLCVFLPLEFNGDEVSSERTRMWSNLEWFQ